MKTKNVVPFSLRMDSDLKEKAEKAAKEDGRSLNGWLKVAIEEKLKRALKSAA